MKKPKLHKQEKSYSCMVACLRMVLEFYGDDFYIHSVVAYQMEENTAYVLDPEDGEKHLNKYLFEQLWQKNDYNGIIINKAV